MVFPDGEDTALPEDGQPSAAPADGTDDGSPAPDSTADGSDIAASDPQGDDGTSPEGTEPGRPKTVPYDRFKEVIGKQRQAEQRAETLEAQVEYLAQMVTKVKQGSPTSPTQQSKAQDALNELIENGEIKKAEAVKLQKIIDAMGYKRGDAPSPESEKVTRLEQQLQSLTKMISEKTDRDEKASVLKQYDGLISEEDLDDTVKEWARSKDPELRYAAEHWSYEKIAKLAFHDKIVQSEVDKALKGKKPPAPPISKKGGDKGPKKPSSDDFEWDPSDGERSREMLKRSIFADIAKEGQ